jgi:hypothetical protein
MPDILYQPCGVMPCIETYSWNRFPIAGHSLQHPETLHATKQTNKHVHASTTTAMKTLIRLASVIHAVITVFFVCTALALIAISVNIGLQALLHDGFTTNGAQGVIEAIGLLSVAVVAVQIAQTIAEEEIIRSAHVSAPTRVRRFLSRFMVVIVVALAIEGMVATFKALHENMALLLHAAGMLAAVGVLLAGWGVFIRLNRYAEELEPEAMADAKREDSKLE